MTYPSSYTTMPIAIIGMSCKLPGGATDPEKLWQLCAEGRSAWSKIPKDRFNQEGFFHPDWERTGTSHVEGGHFLEDISLFDASFFNLSTEVANAMDPQIRMQLESTFEALENAGLSISEVAGSNTSVTAGAFCRDYFESLLRDPEQLPRSTLTANGSAMASNRISHFFDLRGPSLTVDTACSTGLTALHLACQTLRSRESSMAVVTTANLLLNPDMFIALSNIGVLSLEGKSYPWDTRASGYGRGEGVATIVIKPLEDAIRDADPVRAVIRQTALNQDGKTQTITSPSMQAQQELIRMCYDRARLNPADTTYVEAHMTGTPTGDPVEAEAIGSVFSQGRRKGEHLYVGSVKSNIGHTEATSGLASVIKVVLALEKGLIPPNINFDKANPGINLNEWNMQVPTRLQKWPSGRLRRASINNFGYGGSNSHVILDGAFYHLQPLCREIGVAGQVPKIARRSHENHRRVFVLCAKDVGSITATVVKLRDYLQEVKVEDEDSFLGNLAFTLIRRHSSFPWVAAIPAGSISELVHALNVKTLELRRPTNMPQIGFVFNGQGAQWHAMGRELIDAYPIFRESAYEADQCFRDAGSSWSLIEELMRNPQTSRVGEWRLSLPICVALQLCLVRLLTSWGITPASVTSHSSGEYAAAYAAGALSFTQALQSVFLRVEAGVKYIEQCGLQGGMLAVGLAADVAERYLRGIKSGKLVVACVNSPSSITLSGDLDAVHEIEPKFVTDGIFARRLKVPGAYHSHHMLPMAEDYRSSLEQCLSRNGDFGSTRYYSPVTGARIRCGQELGPDHWVRNSVQPVLFAQALQAMCTDSPPESAEGSKKSIDIIVEIGPHGALAGPIRQTLETPALQHLKISYGTCLSRGQDAVHTMQKLVCMLVEMGCMIDLKAVNFPLGSRGLSILSDLPSYSWNHSTRYWKEPRLNQEYRQRSHPSHDLLGSLIPGLSPSTPTWRHFLRVADIPWLADHVVQSQIVYPAAGYICMAVEALRQSIATGGRPISGYRLQDVDIMSALAIPDTADGVEVHVSLQTRDERILDTPEWREFNVRSCTGQNNNWTEHCKGLVCPVFLDHDNGDAHMKDYAAELLGPYESTDCLHNCQKQIQPGDLFGNLCSTGIQHGPSFQNLVAISACQNHSVTTFAVRDTASIMPAQHQQKHVVHPTTLDSIFQAAYPSLPDGASKTLVLPRSIKTMFISRDVSTQEGHQFQSISKLTRADRRGFVASLTTVDKDNGTLRPRIQIQGLFLQALKTMNENKSSFQDAKTHFTTRWLPDFSMMEPQVIAKCLAFESDPSEVMMHQKLQRAAFHFIHDTLAALSEEDVNRMEWYHKELYQWMISQDLNAAANILDPQSATWGHTTEDSKRLLFDDVASQSTDGKMVCRVGKALLPILRKETTALEVMLRDKLLYEYYEKALRYSRSYAQVAGLVRMFAAKHPKARVLEIGAGTGGCTKHVLEALGTRDSWNGMQFSHFDFTDVSSGFFDMARQKFQDWGDMVAYKKLDIEEDPALQSFEVGTYDLVIASGVLHATKVMQQTMLNVRKLLKPGGRLVLAETTKDTIDLHMIFGTLPGWWSSEEIERKQSPNLSVDSWQRLLLRTGFSGIDVEVGDCEEPNACTSVIMSTAIEENPFRVPVSIVFARSLPPAPWLEKLVGAIKTITTLTPTVKDSCGIPEEGEICLFLDDESNPILKEVETFEFEAIRKLLTQANGILWVTKGGPMTGAQPESALCFGLLRTLRLEAQGKRFASLDLDPGNSFWTDSAIRHIVNIFKSTFDSRREIEDVDFEYAERDSVLHIPRVVESQNEGTAALTAWEDLMAQNNRLSGSGRNVFLDLATAGMLDSLHFRDDTSGDQTLPSDFVEIQPKAFGVNFRDVMIAIGQLDDGGHIGIECSGIITGIGAEASSYSLRIGDRVCAIGGHWSTSVRVPWTSVARIPDEMTFEEAASVPTVFLTVYHAFYDVANLKSGETVLIHSGTGGIGQAAIMLAKHIGAVIFVTAGSQEKRDFIHETYGIDHDHIFSSRDSSFVSGIMHRTQGKGVDVILNSLAGPLLQASWNCIARFGRFLEIGKRDIHSAKLLDMEPMRRAASFSAVDLVQIVKYRGHIVTKGLAEILHLMKQSVLQPVKPIRVFAVQQIEQAFRTMQMGKHMGKLVIKPNPGDLVKFIPQRRLTALSADYSYLIVGSINGIGRSIAQWMTQNGAQNLVLLSRSAESSGNNAAITELKRAGFRIFIRNCDVADRGDLERVLDECARTMPPIRGVIQAAMVLQDSVFEMMSLTDWKAATRPKVQATWSLHHCLPKLDFFIILSSLLGVIGNPSQANYSAGGAFQDAFARYRIAQNLPAVSIDLGAVGSVGYVAETSGVAERLEKAGFREVGIDEVLRTIDWAIKNPKGIDNTGQIVTGVFPFDETMNVAWRHDIRFSALRSPALANDHTATTRKRSTHTLKDTLDRGTSWTEAVKLITQAIIEKVASIFALPSSEILASEPLSKYGVDSLVAVELRNWLLMAAQSEVSIFDVLHSPSMSVLAETVSVKSRYVKSAGIHPPVQS